MGTLTEKSEWTEGVRYFEAGVWVTGGPDSSENDPIRDLANRTVWLKETQATLTGRIEVVETGLAEHTEAEDPHPQYVTSPEMESRIGRIEIQGQINADWNATEGAAEILNKPVLATVALSGQYDDLSGKPGNLATTDDTALLQEEITELTNEVAFKVDAAAAAHAAMPSGSGVLLLLSSNPSEYTAPADGYFFGTAYAGTSAGFINFSSNSGMGTMVNIGANNASKVFLPVRKGDVVAVNWGNLTDQTTMMFFYCEGSK